MKPVVDVVDFVETDIRCHVTKPPDLEETDCMRPIVPTGSGEDIT
jgi:hypothetical protein